MEALMDDAGLILILNTLEHGTLFQTWFLALNNTKYESTFHYDLKTKYFGRCKAEGTPDGSSS